MEPGGPGGPGGPGTLSPSCPASPWKNKFEEFNGGHAHGTHHRSAFVVPVVPVHLWSLLVPVGDRKLTVKLVKDNFSLSSAVLFSLSSEDDGTFGRMQQLQLICPFIPAELTSSPLSPS